MGLRSRQHLDKNNKTGFHESFGSNPGMNIDKGENLQVWCDKCEEIRAEEGEWNDRSKDFAKINAICESCFLEIKKANKWHYK